MKAEEIVTKVLTPDVRAAVEKQPHLLEEIYFTDRGGEKRDQHFLRFVFSLPAEDQMELLTPLIKMSVDFIEAIGKIKLSPHAREKIEKNKKEMMAENSRSEAAKRQEEIQKRKFEEMKKREEAIAKLPPDAQRKVPFSCFLA